MIPEKAVLRASQWCYSGIWFAITRWLRVPEAPPELTGANDQLVRSFRPAEGFLDYLKFYFWLGLFAMDLLLLVFWGVLFFAIPWLGLVTAPLWLAVIVLPDIVAYIAIHLQYDTTWYVLSDRTMRIRRGIWNIHETTITYENIQNISIRQGPLQRHFGIADIMVETAGGGAMSGKGEGATVTGHTGLLEGLANTEEVKALIAAKWRQSRSSGVNDDHHLLEHSENAVRWTGEYQTLLEQIRDLSVRLAK